MEFKSIIKGACVGLITSLTFIYTKRTRPDIKNNRDLTPLKDSLIAHRGLFNMQDKPENSLPAIEAAVKENYGIELDVQMTKDGVLVVFHDDSLNRMCGVDKILTEVDYDELKTYRLINSDCHIPTFKSVLEQVDSKVPLCIEIKQAGNYIETTRKVLEALKDYPGFFVIFSFSPVVLETIRKENPKVLRGQLATDYFVEEPQMTFRKKLSLTYLLDNLKSEPDLIIYDYHFFDKLSYQLFRIAHPDVLTAVYTVKNQNQLDKSNQYFDCYIFDSFKPN